METLQQRLMRKVPGLRAPQPVGGIRMPASGFRAPSLPQAIPGVGATKTVLNSPATKGVVKAGGRKLPVVGGLINAGLATYDVSQGADPMRAYGRAATEMAGGALGAGAAGLLAIPSGPGAVAAGAAGYTGGAYAAGAGFDALFPDGPKVGSLDGKRSIANLDGVSYDLSTPEGERGFNNARKARSKGSPVLSSQEVPVGAFGDIRSKFDSAMDPSLQSNNVPAGAFGDIVDKFNNAMSPPSESQIKFEVPTLAATGTDTGSGDRESLREDPRAAPPKELSAGMAAWAAANPKLAKRMVDKVDARRMKNPEYTQSGYDTVRETVYPGNAALAAEQNQGDFSVRDAVGGKMSPEEAGAIASGGFVETVFDKGVQGESTITNDSAEKATNLLSNYKKGLIGKAAGEVEPSAIQNPITPGGDGTPDGAVSELQKKTVYEAPPSMIGMPLGEVNSKLNQLGGDEFLKQMQAGRFHGR